MRDSTMLQHHSCGYHMQRFGQKSRYAALQMRLL